jgi:hypothetical protein
MIPSAIEPLLKSQQQGGSVRIWHGSPAISRRIAKASDVRNSTVLDRCRSVVEQPAQRKPDGHLGRGCHRRICRTWLD